MDVRKIVWRQSNGWLVEFQLRASWLVFDLVGDRIWRERHIQGNWTCHWINGGLEAANLKVLLRVFGEPTWGEVSTEGIFRHLLT